MRNIKMFIRWILIVMGFLSLINLSFAGQLIYSTFLGGGSGESSYGIAIDSSGNTYITGITNSSDFPTTPGVLLGTYLGTGDVFVTKINPSGTALVYSTFLGGKTSITSGGIAVDSSGNAYISGFTNSTNLPTTPGAFDTSYNGGSFDVYACKLNANGTALLYSTYLGGASDDRVGNWGNAIAVDGSGNAYITGYSASSNFPATVGAFDTSYNGNYDIFVTQLNPSGTALVYSTFLGGGNEDDGFGIAVDSVGNAYITGDTYSSNFPTTPGVFDTTYNVGTNDGFVSKLNPNGTTLLYSTFLGGGNNDSGIGITIDDSENVYITGYTSSSANFPTTPGAFDTTYNGGTNDGFVSKLNPNGTTLLYSTFLGGGNNEYGYSIAIDGSENAYITGFTESSNFPTTPGAFDTTYGSSTDNYVSQINAGGTTLLYSTFLGGGSLEYSADIVVDGSGNAYVAGFTKSSDFPTTLGAYDTTYNGGQDAFVSKFNLAPPPALQGVVVYSDINKNSFVDSGDTLTLQFNDRMVINGATASDFFIPVTGDSLGTGASISVNPDNDTQVVITLGTSPTLTISSTFNIGNTGSGSPSGIDISATMTPDAIESIDGVDAIDGGTPYSNDNANDIRYDLIGTSTSVSAFSSATVHVSQDTINAYYTEHKLIIPSGSLAVSTTITISKPGDNHGHLSAVSFEPITISFSTSTPAIVVLEYKDADIKSQLGYLENSLRIHQFSTTSNQYELIPDTYGSQSVDMVNQTVSVPIATFDVFNQDTVVPFANISLPTVGAGTSIVTPNPSSPIEEIITFSPLSGSVTVNVSTSGIYIKHQLYIPDYQITISGVTVILMQATLVEKHNWSNNAVLKVLTYGDITTPCILTMEYKDYNHPQNQFTNDVIGGAEFMMRIYRWRESTLQWELVPGLQNVNTGTNIVSATIYPLNLAQIYAIQVDPAVPVELSEFGTIAD